MTIALGVDGGATKTEAILINDAGRVLGWGLGGPSNYNAVGIEATQRHIGEAAGAACRMADLDPGAVDGAFLGLAAIVSAADRALIHQAGVALELAAPERIGVDHDCRIALAGGLSGRPGIVQIAGTGSSTFGINAAGEGWRVGGWGQLISDEGSGYWLGVQAMRGAVCAYDGRLEGTLLYDAVMDALNLTDINDIMPLIYVQGLAKDEIAGSCSARARRRKERRWCSSSHHPRGRRAVGALRRSSGKAVGHDRRTRGNRSGRGPLPGG